MKKKRMLGVFLLFLAMVLIGDGCWIKIKAILAQVLLQRAWHQTMIHGKPVKAWPWADTWPVARLRIQRLGVDAIVLEGDSGEVLAFGPGHLSASAQPAAEGNCVLAGHRDTSFAFLAAIHKGDILSVQGVGGKERTYRIMSTVVERYDHLFFEGSTAAWLTLITCYPFNSPVPGGPLRFIAFAKEEKGIKIAVAAK
jgi:sortase A